MSTESAINKVLRDAVNAIVGIPEYAIRAQQGPDAPRPEGPYADVQFIAEFSAGTEQTAMQNNGPDLQNDIFALRVMQFSIGCYRDNALENARKLKLGLKRESIQSTFRAANIGLGERSDVRNISEPLENGWEERGQFDVSLHVVGTDTEIIRAINVVSIDGEVQFGSRIHNVTIEVN